MTRILDLVPKGAWMALTALLLAVCASQLVSIAKGRSLLAEERAVNARNMREMANMSLQIFAREITVANMTVQLSEMNRAAEAQAAAKAKEIADVVIAEKKRTERAVAAAVAHADRRLRDELAAFAAGTTATAHGAPASTTGAGLSAEDRATTLGDLLATCRREAVSDAGELEDLASQIRGLLDFVATSAAALK